MVSRKKKKTTVSVIRQPTSFNFDIWTSGQHCFFAITTFAFREEAKCFACHHRFLLLNLARDRVCPLAHFASQNLAPVPRPRLSVFWRDRGGVLIVVGNDPVFCDGSTQPALRNPRSACTNNDEVRI